ncbi:MAG: hypothetical protein JO347_05705, partial [Candidatus Eremiobacteraeota bacterium]|nr:hypothetical protein [Candidatus Eremiobacteraeota bacterium]
MKLRAKGKHSSVVVAAAVTCTLSVTIGAASASPDAPSALAHGMSAAQWASLNALKHSALIVPAYLPDGYRVVGVQIQRNTLTLGGESYTITYSNGSNKIDWYVSNVQAGGDAPPASFRTEYNSSVLGRGVVYYDTGCWLSRVRDGGVAGEDYGISACGPDIS